MPEFHEGDEVIFRYGPGIYRARVAEYRGENYDYPYHLTLIETIVGNPTEPIDPQYFGTYPFPALEDELEIVAQARLYDMIMAHT